MSNKPILAVFGATGAQGGGVVRAALADQKSPFAVRAVTRNVQSDKARALAAQGVEVVTGNIDDEASLVKALSGAQAAFCVTNYWEHFSAERETTQGKNLARAAKQAAVQHAIWSTFEDVREYVPLITTRACRRCTAVQGPALRRQGRGEFDLHGLGRADDVPADVVLLGELHLLRIGAAARTRDGPRAHIPLCSTSRCRPLPARTSAAWAYGVFLRPH